MASCCEPTRRSRLAPATIAGMTGVDNSAWVLLLPPIRKALRVRAVRDAQLRPLAQESQTRQKQRSRKS